MMKRNLLGRILLGAVLLVGVGAAGAAYAGASECVDSDGDGWGWDGVASCIPGEEPTAVAPQSVGNPTPPPAPADCVDSDGDGWGWDGLNSCEMPERQSDPTTDQPPLPGSSPVNQPAPVNPIPLDPLDIPTPAELIPELPNQSDVEESSTANTARSRFCSSVAFAGADSDNFGVENRRPCEVLPGRVEARDKWLAALDKNGRDYNKPDRVMDEATKLDIANEFADAFGARPGLIDFTIRRTEGGRVHIDANASRSYAECSVDTWINNSDGKIVLQLGTLAGLQIHELAHIADCEGGRGRVNGVPNGMSSEQRAILVSERRKITTLYNTDSSLVAAVFDYYAFTNVVEFWAETTEAFLTSAQRRVGMAAQFPELHDVVRDYYYRDDLPAAADYDFERWGQPELFDNNSPWTHHDEGHFHP